MAVECIEAHSDDDNFSVALLLSSSSRTDVTAANVELESSS